MTTRSKRRRFRFSLRTLLVVFLVLGLGLGWFAYKMRQAERQRRAVEGIEEVGGRVWYDYELEAHQRGKAPEPPAPAWLRELIGDDLFADVSYVHPYLYYMTALIVLRCNDTTQ